MNRERINEILEVLSSNKLRTLLTAFGVFWGIFIFIFLLALTSGLKNGVSLSFKGMAANSMFIWGQRTTMPFKGNPKGKPISFKLADVEAIKKEFKELKYVSPRNRLGGYAGANNVTRNNKTGAFQVNADFPEYINQEPLEILKT
jgi:putative ABC transport system permease protein